MGRLIGKYWQDEPFIFQAGARGASFAKPIFPYRLEDYINALCGVGFHIFKIIEPRLTEEMGIERGAVGDKVPLSLWLGAQKP